ncbi:MAG TPA: hypothetical protein VGW33_05845 [Terriglobia bacterium]|nr:hypothetical protein [Terriglobia bacterium]
MRIELALNLFWAGLALAALGALALSELRRRNNGGWRARSRRGLAVFVAAVALFPSVSASDDFARYEQLQAGPGTHAQWSGPLATRSNNEPALYLARLADALENLQISVAPELLLTLCFFAWVSFAAKRGAVRIALSATSRAPPLPALT